MSPPGNEGHVVRLAELAQGFSGLPHRRDCLAIRIELQNLAGETRRQIHLLVRVEEQAARQAGERPFLDKFSVKVEYLHAAILAVGDVDHPLGIDDHRVRDIELPGSLPRPPHDLMNLPVRSNRNTRGSPRPWPWTIRTSPPGANPISFGSLKRRVPAASSQFPACPWSRA